MMRFDLINKFRLILFQRSLNIISVLTLVSIATLLTGIYNGLSDRPDYTGLYSHSMILGPMAGISSLYFAKLAENSKNKLERTFFTMLLLSSLLACVAAGSRIALIASFVALIFFYVLTYQLYNQRFFKRIFTLIFLLIISSPFWIDHTQFLLGKMEFSDSKGDALFSRSDIWSDRVDEFKSSPLIGVGFSSVDTRISEEFDVETGIVEPGSSWLAILSMTGLLGFCIYSLILIKPMIWLIKHRKAQKNNIFYLCLLILFYIHMVAEGYILSAGSGMLFILLLSISVIDQQKILNEQ
jgi:hypothetical protein